MSRADTSGEGIAHAFGVCAPLPLSLWGAEGVGVGGWGGAGGGHRPHTCRARPSAWPPIGIERTVTVQGDALPLHAGAACAKKGSGEYPLDARLVWLEACAQN